MISEVSLKFQDPFTVNFTPENSLELKNFYPLLNLPFVRELLSRALCPREKEGRSGQLYSKGRSTVFFYFVRQTKVAKKVFFPLNNCCVESPWEASSAFLFDSETKQSVFKDKNIFSGSRRGRESSFQNKSCRKEIKISSRSAQKACMYELKMQLTTLIMSRISFFSSHSRLTTFQKEIKRFPSSSLSTGKLPLSCRLHPALLPPRRCVCFFVHYENTQHTT